MVLMGKGNVMDAPDRARPIVRLGIDATHKGTPR